MHMIMLALTLTLAPAAPPDLFSIQADLQGLYDEVSQASLQFETLEDANQFHEVLYTPDWVFVDASGQSHTWPQLRDQVLHAPPVTAATQPIQRLSLVPGGAVTTVNEVRTRAIVDEAGRYGRKGAPHMLTETTAFKDTWIQVGDQWKLKSRQQLGPPKVQVDVSDYGT
jgi:hypothetical protein